MLKVHGTQNILLYEYSNMQYIVMKPILLNMTKNNNINNWLCSRQIKLFRNISALLYMSIQCSKNVQTLQKDTNSLYYFPKYFYRFWDQNKYIIFIFLIYFIHSLDLCGYTELRQKKMTFSFTGELFICFICQILNVWSTVF